MQLAWPVLPLGSIVELQRGFDLPINQRSYGSVPVVGASGVIGQHDEEAVVGPGVTLGRAGAIGVATYVPCNFWPLNTTLFVTDFLGNNRKFIYYLLRSMDFSGYNSGGVQPMLNRNYIRDIPVPLPSYSEQQAIVEVLGALDDKIAVNERIAKTIADLCRAMMQSMWQQGDVSSLTVAHAPTNPEWSRTTLAELCATGGGSIQTGPFGSQLHASDYVGIGIPSVMPQNIGDNVIVEDGIARIADADAIRLSKYLLIEGDIVYSRRGDVKRRALVRRQESGWLCGTGCLRVRAGSSVEPLFLSHYLGEPEVQDWIQRHAVGATMPNLNTSILGAVPVVLPASDLRARINAELSAFDARSSAAIDENKTLIDLRDTLLPQLVTGKIRVKDAVRVVEDVAS